MGNATPGGAGREDKTNASVRRMNGIMQRKLSLLYEMHNLSSQAYGYLSEDGVEPLGNIYEAKQALIDEVDHLDKLFLHEFENLKAGLGLTSIADLSGNGSPLLKELKLNTSEILGPLEKIEGLDSRLNLKILKMRDDIAADLARVRKQKQVSGTYSSDGPPRPKFDQADYSSQSSFDKKK